MTAKDLIVVGYIKGVHGIKGELKLLLDVSHDAVDEFTAKLRDEWKSIFIDGKPHVLEGVRRNKDILLITLEGLRDRDVARGFTGKEVSIEKSLLPELPEGDLYIYEIIGMSVVTEDGVELGVIKDVISTGANDVYEVHGDRGEILLPAIDDVILDVDTEARRITVHLLEGLMEDAPKQSDD